MTSHECPKHPQFCNTAVVMWLQWLAVVLPVGVGHNPVTGQVQAVGGRVDLPLPPVINPFGTCIYSFWYRIPDRGGR